MIWHRLSSIFLKTDPEICDYIENNLLLIIKCFYYTHLKQVLGTCVVAPSALHCARVPHHSVARSRLSNLILARPENAFSPSSICCFSPGSSSAHRAESPSRQTPLPWLLTSHSSLSCLNSPVIFFMFFFLNLLFFFFMYQLNISFLTPTCVF